MIDSLFQTFLLLAYFDIALIAITVANYAVSASYLGRETRLSRKRMDRKKQELLQKLKELRKEAQIDEIKKKIKESEAEKRRLGIRITLLSWLGAVILPSMFFGFSLVLAVVGMNSEILVNNPQFLQQQSMIFSVGSIVIGFMVLLFIIRTIDSAARRIPLPKLEINFANGSKKESVRSGEVGMAPFCFKNDGEDIAEALHFFVLFPPEFEVHKSGAYRVSEQRLSDEFPHYNAAIWEEERIHIGVTRGIEIKLTMPKKEDVYEIPIEVYERKIGMHKDKLVIQVTK